LIDKDGELSKAFQIGNNVPDMLSRKASLYMGFAAGDFPLDAIPIFFGIIASISFPPGRVLISVSHPDKLKNYDIYSKIETPLTADIDAVVTVIPVTSTLGMFSDQDALTSYVVIDDEIMKVNSISATSISVTRAALNTIADAHSIDTSASSMYQLTGDSMDLALKVMLSGGPLYYEDNHFISNIVDDNLSINIANAILVDAEDIVQSIGLAEGDLITITGATNPANNVVDAKVLFIDRISDTFYAILDATLVVEHGTPAVFKVKTPYNVLPDGLKMLPNQVDVKGHQDLKALFPSNFIEISPYLKESINGKDFVNKDVYFPVGLYSIPRKGRSSVGFTSPPLATELLPVLDETNILNPNDLRAERSISKNFYNATVWRFNQDSLSDKFLAGEIFLSEKSLARIESGTRPLKVDAIGLRDTGAHRQYIKQQSFRFLERYQYAPEFVKNVKLLPKDSYAIEIGDIVAFGSEGLQLTNISDGNRKYETTLMEVHNKTLDLVTYNTSIDLVNTAYEIDKKFAVISPASNIIAGSTTTQIVLTRSYSTKDYELEKKKWQSFIGHKVFIHSLDWTYQEYTILNGFDASNPDIALVDALSSAPLDTYIMDIPTYDNSEDIYRISFCHFDPIGLVFNGLTDKIFEVIDPSDFFIGSLVRIHSTSFSIYSEESTVINISGNTIIVDDSLGLTPGNGQTVELIGFKETEGIPYAIV